MNVGPKVASACWIAVVAAATALVAFGFSVDPDAEMRDSMIELKLLHDGPTNSFIEHCQGFEKRRERGLFIVEGEAEESKADWVRRIMGPALVSSSFQVKGLLWCPFPSSTMTVRESLEVVNDVDNSSRTLWPHSSFLMELGKAVQKQQQSEAAETARELQMSMFQNLAKSMAEGRQLTSIRVTADRSAGSHALFDCASTEAIFDSSTRKLPTSPIQLIISLPSERGVSVYCFNDKEVPTTVQRLYGASGSHLQGLHRGYFGSQILKASGYSNKEAAKFEIRSLPPERRGVPDKNGVVYENESVGFDFPAIRAQLKDIGALRVEDAYNHVKGKLDRSGQTAEVFGVKLPVVPFLTLVGVALPLLGVLFLVGLSIHGKGALPETLQELPGGLLGPVVLGGFTILPALGAYVSSFRISLLLPELATPLRYGAYAWALLSLILLTVAWRRKTRTAA